MRTFIIRARKGSTRGERIRSLIGSKEHFEVVLHSVINAFFISSGFRDNVEFYIILDSAEDFPRTLKLTASEGLSFTGFHEEAILTLIEKALLEAKGLKKDETRDLDPGVQISGYGFEKCVGSLLENRSVYSLSPKGEDVRSISLSSDPVFVLSDHLAMPPKSIKGLQRRGMKSLSLGKKMLFASQCVSVLHYELDRLFTGH